MTTRREALVLLAGSTAGALLSTSSTAGASMDGAIGSAEYPTKPVLPPERRWLAKLGVGLPEEYDYVAEIEGRLPLGLMGTLYRNGPGLFERNGFSKRTLFDGDGMIRATTFADGTARFRNRFVQTQKYNQESKAGRFLYPTWTTPAPSFFDNFPGFPTRSQAGVTLVIKNGTLFAFDEVGKPYGLDPLTLATTGPIDPYESENDNQQGPAGYKAHTKTDGETGDWVLAGFRGRRNPNLQVLVKDRTGRQIAHTAVPNPRDVYTYYHDFFWAGRYAVFHLQPAYLSPVRTLIGLRPFADSLSWRPEKGSLLLIVDPAAERPAMTLEVPASWMWHTVNAYTTGNTIIADFVGYDSPDHFLGPDAAIRAIMQGREGIAKAPGTLRRFTIDLVAKRARLETVADGHFEFPTINPARAGHQHRYSYFASGTIAQGWFHDGIARIDAETGAVTDYRFGSDHYVGEPVFTPDSLGAALSAAEDRGWLLCEVLEGKSEKSFIAIFDAAHVNDGPIARVQLHHHLPMSFHGWWQAA
jgi:all-trans-8'-apo-beta-carotenal 15,15'-oxygenase